MECRVSEDVDKEKKWRGEVSSPQHDIKYFADKKFREGRCVIGCREAFILLIA
jgi:hypothetical protein